MITNLVKHSDTYRTFDYNGISFFAQRTQRMFSTGTIWCVYRKVDTHRAELFSTFDNWNLIVKHFKQKNALQLQFS